MSGSALYTKGQKQKVAKTEKKRKGGDGDGDGSSGRPEKNRKQGGGAGHGHEKKFSDCTVQVFVPTTPVATGDQMPPPPQPPAVEAAGNEDDMDLALVSSDGHEAEETGTAADPFAAPQSFGDERATLWLDDVTLAFMAVIQHEFGKSDGSGFDSVTMPKVVSKNAVLRVAGFFYSVLLQFCWAKSVSVNGKAFKTWSSLRPVLQDLVHKALVDMKAGQVDGILTSGNAGNQQNVGITRLLASCQAPEDEEVKEKTSSPEEPAEAIPAASAKAWSV